MLARRARLSPRRPRLAPAWRAALLALALAPAAADAHGVELQVQRSAAGIAVRARHHGDRPLAGAIYEVVSPAAPGQPHDTGRTDRHGWLAFVPDVPGRWTVRIVDASGHGKVHEIDVPADAVVVDAAARPATDSAGVTAVAGAAAPARDAGVRSPPLPPLGATEASERATSIYRMIGGLAVIGLVFVVLFAVMLRRRAPGK